jgi:hypothetical protein
LFFATLASPKTDVPSSTSEDGSGTGGARELAAVGTIREANKLGGLNIKE